MAFGQFGVFGIRTTTPVVLATGSPRPSRDAYTAQVGCESGRGDAGRPAPFRAIRSSRRSCAQYGVTLGHRDVIGSSLNGELTEQEVSVAYTDHVVHAGIGVHSNRCSELVLSIAK